MASRPRANTNGPTANTMPRPGPRTTACPTGSRWNSGSTASAAKHLGAVEAYSRRLFEAIFVEGRALAESDLVDLAEDAGLDAAAFRAQLDDPATAETHEATLKAAHRRGAFGVPTFFVGEQMFWGNDRLVLLEHEIRRAQASET